MFRHIASLVLTFSGLLGITGSTVTQASTLELSHADAKAIEQVIRKQIAAFERDDAKGAFAYAAPSVQLRFGRPDRFMDAVRETYAPVYRPNSVVFLTLERVKGQPVQTVQVASDDGHVWLALYHMERQSDRSWKISGCELVATAVQRV